MGGGLGRDYSQLAILRQRHNPWNVPPCTTRWASPSSPGSCLQHPAPPQAALPLLTAATSAEAARPSPPPPYFFFPLRLPWPFFGGALPRRRSRSSFSLALQATQVQWPAGQHIARLEPTYAARATWPRPLCHRHARQQERAPGRRLPVHWACSCRPRPKAPTTPPHARSPAPLLPTHLSAAMSGMKGSSLVGSTGYHSIARGPRSAPRSTLRPLRSPLPAGVGTAAAWQRRSVAQFVSPEDTGGPLGCRGSRGVLEDRGSTPGAGRYVKETPVGSSSRPASRAAGAHNRRRHHQLTNVVAKDASPDLI